MLKSVKRTLLAGANAGWLNLRSLTIDANRLWRSAECDNHSFDIIVPFSEHEANQLALPVDAVRNQICPNWNLTMVAMSQPPCEVAIPIDGRIRLFNSEKEITRAEAIRVGVDNSAADFVAIMSPEIRLEEDALFWASLTLRNRPDAKWLYFDHIEEAKTVHPICKPNFSRELLFSTMFTGPLNFVDRAAQ